MSEGKVVRRTVLAAHAKVNLVLDVLGPRADGYTEIATVFQTVGLADGIEVAVDPLAVGQRLVVRGEEPCPPEQNLALRAARACVERFGVVGGVTVTLEKHIPAGAGLGGGSSDAAAVLRGLDVLTGHRVNAAELTRCAAALGADVPYFLTGGLALGRGRGDEIEPLPDLPVWPIVLARAGRPLATSEVFNLARRRLTAQGDAPNILRFQRHLRDTPLELPPVANGLLPAARSLEPLIPLVLEALQRAGGRASMTGSGSTVFGLFAEEGTAREAAARLPGLVPVTFVHCTETVPRGRLGGPAGRTGHIA